MAFDYFTPGEAEQYAFYRVPKLLITGEQFRTLSMEAKLLYGILLDRVSLSLRHGWVDEQNHVYIIYTIEQIMNEMNCSNKKAVTMLSELEKKVALIEKKRQGLGKPNLIYVKNFFTANQPDCEYDQPENTLDVDNLEMESSEMSNVHPQKCKNDTSGSVEDTFAEVKEVHGTNTNINVVGYYWKLRSYRKLGIVENEDSLLENAKLCLPEDIFERLKSRIDRMDDENPDEIYEADYYI